MANDLARRTWPWMTLAVVAVAAFMFWLYRQSSQVQDGLASATPSDTVAGPPSVSDNVFAQAPEQFRDRILLRSIAVNEVLGRASFSLELPGRTGYPAVLERHLVEQETRVVNGDRLDIAGEVYALNDSIISVWSQRGIFDIANREKLAESTTFFLVDSLDFVMPGEEDAEPADGQAQATTGAAPEE